jgi:hypothetical protein
MRNTKEKVLLFSIGGVTLFLLVAFSIYELLKFVRF